MREIRHGATGCAIPSFTTPKRTRPAGRNRVTPVSRFPAGGFARAGLTALLLFCALASAPAHAHRPVIVKDKSSLKSPVELTEPEISRAFYGELAGAPHAYKVVSSEPFNFYVNILVPDPNPEGAAVERHDMSFRVFEGEAAEGDLLFEAEGLSAPWRRFYEKYGRDHYYMGPEFELRCESGVYHVIVYNDGNRGRYALAIGRIEKFTFFSLIGAMVRAGSLDRWFFK